VEVLGHREELGLRVVVVAFAPPQSLAGYQRGQGLGDVLVLSDPGRLAYEAFGFGRGSFARVWLDPRVWRSYARLIRGGRRLEPAHEDTRQLAGDVLVDADARIRWIYRGQGPEDRPSIETIAAVLRRARRPTAGRESFVRRDLSDE
jgi:hypothetical protein